MTSQATIRVFWIKLIAVVLVLGGTIGYFGYKHSKPPAYVTLSNMLLRNQAIMGQVEDNTKRINSLDHRLSNLEKSKHNDVLGN